ncbi:MAG: protein kinase [Acidobacteria bacterium]|nr:protein kinase [Acidobacteriota bacterium]
MTPARWQQVDQWLEAALEQPLAERAAFLAQTCNGDEALRQEVLSLVAGSARADDFFEAPPVAEMSAALQRAESAVAPGQHIGPYRILRELGRGGMGVVLLAVRDDDVYQKQVAIKLVSPNPLQPELLRRFRRERQILANLDHPHIARLLDGGNTEQGWPYLVMEYIEGVPLAQYCQQQKTPLAQRLALFRDVCGAVQYAHQNLIIHRDLKPGNILVTAAGEAKLLDFGIAKLLDPQHHQLTAHATLTGTQLMTPEYASPEQMRGEQITTASDVYSLGVLLYELLTGQSPYRFKSQALPEIIRTVCEDEALPPSVRMGQSTVGADLRVCQRTVGADLRVGPGRGLTSAGLSDAIGADTQVGPYPVLPAELKGDLDLIALTALNKEVPRRYGSVEQLSEDLRRYLAGEPILARTATFGYRIGKFVRRNQLGVSTAVLVLLTLIGGIIGTTWQARVAQEQARVNRRLAYAGQMHQAVQAWEIANMEQLGDLLEQSKPQPGEEDLRGFEWYHLWRLAYRHGERYSLPHPSDVWAVGYSPDGQRIASGCADNKLRVWDAATGRALATFSGHTGNIWAIAFSPDGQRIATASGDRTAKLWDAATGRELLTFNGHTNQVMSVAFAPDGKTLATGGRDNTLKLWDVGTGRELRSLQSNASWVNAVAFSPDGRLLATGHAITPNLKLWDAATGRELRAFNEFACAVLSVAFAPDGKSVAVGYRNRFAQLFEVSSGKLLAMFKGHAGEIRTVALSPDGKLLATGSADRTVKLWRAVTGEEVATLKGHLGQIWSVAFAPDGQRLITSGDDHTARLWDIPAALEFTALKFLGGQQAFALFSPDGRILAVTGQTYTVRLLDAATGQELVTIAERADLTSLAFSPDGKSLATGNRDGKVSLWDADTGQEFMTFKGHTAQVNAVTYSPDGQRLATASSDKTVKVCQAATGQELFTFKGHTKLVRAVAFSPDGKRLASAGYDNVARLWDSATGRELAVLNGHTEPLLALAFAPDGKTLATGSADNTAKLWDVATGRALGTFKGHAGHVRCLAFSPDGTRLATGSAEGMVRLWDVATQQEIIALKGHDDAVGSVAFAPDGQTLVSSGTDGVVRFWRAATRQEVTGMGGQ